MDLDVKIYNPKAIRNKISSSKNELIDSGSYEKYVNTDYDKNFILGLLLDNYDYIIENNIKLYLIFDKI